MDNVKVAKTWGAAAAIIAAIMCVVAAALGVTAPAGGQQGQPCSPAVVIQWQPQSILETKLSARIIEDNKAILNGLQALAKDPRLTEKDMMGYLGNTYLRTPRLWTKDGWVEGWANVLPKLKVIIARDSRPVINAVSALIEYRPYAGAKTPAEDIDALVTVRMTFSASPGDNILTGRLQHSRPCPIDPVPGGNP